MQEEKTKKVKFYFSRRDGAVPVPGSPPNPPAPAAQIDGKSVSGDWFRTELKSGLRTIHLHFDRQPEIRFHEELEAPVNSRARWESGEGAAMLEIFRTEPARTIVYGPVLLARSKFIGNTEDEMFASALPAGFQVKLSPEPHPKTR